jgi:hypothetical protein
METGESRAPRSGRSTHIQTGRPRHAQAVLSVPDVVAAEMGGGADTDSSSMDMPTVGLSAMPAGPRRDARRDRSLKPLKDDVLDFIGMDVPMATPTLQSASGAHTAPPPAQTAVPSGEEPMPQKKARMLLPCGTAYFMDERGAEGEKGHYRRYRVLCPLAGTQHAGGRSCEKYRSAALSHDMGPVEPLAYLGAWAAASTDCGSRAAHVAFRPGTRAVRAYMERYPGIALDASLG